MQRVLFNGWTELLEVLITVPLAYAVVIGVLRASGKRALSKMNAYDFVITVAMGSTLATLCLSRDVSLAKGGFAFALLAGMQHLLSMLSRRHDSIKRMLRADPSIVYHRGRYIDEVMDRERVTRSDIQAAMRGSGATSEAEVEAVVLETNGNLSCLTRRKE